MLRGKYSSSVRPLIQVVPSPGRRITRATDVLRLPVPLYCACSAIAILQRKRLRSLRLVRMLGARVDLQLEELRATETGAREHAPDGLADDLCRAPLELLAKRAAAQAAGIAGV